MQYVILGHGNTPESACTDTGADLFYIDGGQLATSMNVYYDEWGLTFAQPQYYAQGDVVRYWNGQQFTSYADCSSPTPSPNAPTPIPVAAPTANCGSNTYYISEGKFYGSYFCQSPFGGMVGGGAATTYPITMAVTSNYPGSINAQLGAQICYNGQPFSGNNFEYLMSPFPSSFNGSGSHSLVTINDDGIVSAVKYMTC